MAVNLQALVRRFAFFGALCSIFPNAVLAQQARRSLPVANTALPADVVSLGAAPASTMLSHISIALHTDDSRETALSQYLADVTNSASANYHHWLTPQEFADRFGATASEVSTATAWLESQGVHVTGSNAARTLLQASASTATAQKVFGVTLRQVVLAGNLHVVQQGDLSISGTAPQSIAAVSGLDDLDTSSLATAEVSVDGNSSGVLRVSAVPTSQQDWRLLLQQANAQGITVLSDASSGYAEMTAIAPSTLTEAIPGTEARPSWQVAEGLPADGLRAAPDFVYSGDFSSTVNRLITKSGGRLGNINATLYLLAAIPGVFTPAEGSETGAWTSLTGLGTVNPDEIVKRWPLGTTSSSVSVTSAPIPVTYGSALTLTATVTGSGATPTGTVTFVSDKAGTLGNASLDSSGKAVLTINTLDAGQYNFTASYAGDGTYATSSTISSAGNTILPQGLIVTAAQSGSAVIGTNATINVTVTTTSGKGHALGTVSAQAQGVSDTNSYTGTLVASSTDGQSTASISFPMRKDETSPFTVLVSCTPASGNYACYSPATMTLTPSNGNTTSNTSITSSTFVPTHGQNFTLTATVTSGASVLTPTGTITFSSSSTGILGTATLDSTGKATYTTKTLAGGQYSFNATYSGDINFATSTSPVPATVSVQPETASVSAILNGTAAYGSNATISVSVAGTSGVGNPTGTVSAQGQGTTDQKAYSATLTAAGSTTSRSTATITYPVSEKNTFTVLISCTSGDSSFTCPNPYTLSITPGATKTNSTTTLISSPNPPVTGSVTTFTATVVSGSASVTTIPTGSVDFLDNGIIIGSSTLTAGKAAFSTTLDAGAVHILTAAYSGDSVYNNSTSASLSTTAGSTASTVTLSSNPSPPVAGRSVTFTATVSSVSSAAIVGRVTPLATPTGTVTFLDNGVALGTSTLTSGVATYTTTLAAGTVHSVTAAYSGSGTFATSTSSAIAVQAATGTTASTTSLVASSYGVTGGTNITFTSTVKSSSASVTTTPTGSVTLTDSKDGVIGTGTIGTDGTVNISNTSLSAGTHSIIATYSGDTNYAASSSSAIVVTITPASGPLTASISPNPGIYGSTATVTATVAVTSGTANGTMQATLNGQTYSGTVTAGTASISVNVPPPGTYPLVVSCPSTNNFTCTNSVTLSYTTKKGTTTTTVTSSSSAALAGDTITLTATIANAGNGTGTYTYSGTVTFLDGTKTIGTGTVVLGTATTDVTLTGAGTHAITAVYSGDTNWTGSTSTAVGVIISKVDSVLALSASATTAVNGTNIVFRATASRGSTTTLPPPTGTVTFYDTVGSNVITLGTGTLAPNGTLQSITTVSSTGLQPGTHSLYALYAGDTNYKSSTSNTLIVTISDFAISFNPSTLTVSQGKSAQAQVIISSSGGFSGTVTLGCTPPAGTLMTCALSPAALNTSGTSTLTVTTTANTAALDRRSIPVGLPLGGGAVVAALCLMLPGKRRRVSLLMGILAALLTLSASGCATGRYENTGGGDSGGSTNNGTPYGTQLLTVTAAGTDGGNPVRHNYTYQVTVQ